jgi:hypothetical protein
MWETILVIAIVMLAGGTLAVGAIRKLTQKSTGCGGCRGCGQHNAMSAGCVSGPTIQTGAKAASAPPHLIQLNMVAPQK